MKGMVIIDSNHFGKSMELVECIKDKVMELVEELSYGEKEEPSYNRDYRMYPEEREYPERRTSKGRYNY